MDGPEIIWVARLDAVLARPFFRLGTGMFLKLLSELTADSTRQSADLNSHSSTT